MKQDRFGINMRAFCRAHEAWVAEALNRETVSRACLETHLEKLRWLQHERLVHLIVLCLTAGAELFLADLSLLHPALNPAALLLLLGMTVLLGCYFAHYFFLENTTQHWYRLAEQLMARVETRDR